MTNESSQTVTANAMTMHNLHYHLNMAFHNAQATYIEHIIINNGPELSRDACNTVQPGQTMYLSYDCFFI